MKKRNLFLTLGLSLTLGVGVAAGLGASRVEAKEALAAESITIYFAGVGSFGSHSVHVALNGDFHDGVATTGEEKSIGQWKVTFNVASGNKVNAYMHEGSTYWHPYSGTGTEDPNYWNTNYSDIATGSYVAGKKYIITYTGFDHGWDNQENKWFTYTFEEYATQTVYCLDKTNSLFNENRNVHVWGASAETDWPGISMTLYSGRIYSATFNSVLDHIIFNNKADNTAGTVGTNQTDTLEIESGKCFVLESNFTGRWVSLAAAQFIDQYMHFNNVSESNNNDTGACRGTGGYYEEANNAYSVLSNDVKAEVNSVSGVSARLAAWKANYDANKVAGIFSFAPSANDGNLSLIIVLAASISLVAVASFFVIRRRKEQE